MATAQTTEQIIIEFVADTDSLDSGLDRLSNLGKVDKASADIFKKTNIEIANRNKELAVSYNQFQRASAGAKGFVSTLSGLDSKTKSLVENFIHGFLEQAQVEIKQTAKGMVILEDGVKEVGTAVDDAGEAVKKFSGETDKNEKSQQSLKSRIKELKFAMADLKLQGKDNTEQYRLLKEEAGELNDTLADVSAEIRTTGSDTKNIEGLVSIASGIASGFAIAQGATALFGDESEELQKTLLKVNAAMAILQGLQQIQNVLQKESAASLLLNEQATKINIIAQQAYTASVGGTTGAMKLLRLAFIGTGIGGLILLLVAGTKLLYDWATAASRAEKETLRLAQANKLLNDSLVESNEVFIKNISARKEQLQKELAFATARGDSDQKLIELRRQIANEDKTISEQGLKNLGLTEAGVELLESKYIGLINKRTEYLKIARAEDTTKAQQDATKKIVENLDLQIESTKSLLDAGKELVKQRKDGEQEVALIAAENIKLNTEAAKVAAEKAKDERLKQLNDELAFLEFKKLKTDEDTQARINVEKKIIDKKAEIEKASAVKTKNELLLIDERAINDRAELQSAFTIKQGEKQIQLQIAQNAKQISLLSEFSAQRLDLTLQNIALEAQAAIDAAEGDEAKITLIKIQAAQNVLEAKKRFIEEAANYEIEVQNLSDERVKRALERQAKDIKIPVEARVSALREIANLDINDVDRQLKSLDDLRDAKLISEEKYLLEYGKLQNKREKIVEDAEENITKFTTDETKKRVDTERERVAQILDAFNQISVYLADIANSSLERQSQALDGQKKELDALKETGKITEEEYKKRMQAIEREDKRIKTEQAKRDKQTALFSALINIAVQITRALGNPFQLALIAALGAAQVAAIASRPIPKFAKGKKDSYSGLAEVGEAGAELVEMNGRMFLATKPSLTWLGAKDKVYTAAETNKMLTAPMPVANKGLLSFGEVSGASGSNIDYDKLGKVISKNIPHSGIDINEAGFKAWMKNANMKTEYLNNKFKL